jgi:hypothetical protein
MYYTLPTNHQDYTSLGTGSLAVYPGEGDRVVAAISFRGALVVFKYPLGIYIIDTSDPDTANWKVTPMTRAVGSLNQHALVPIDNDVFYMSVGGQINALSTTQEFGDLKTSDIGFLEHIEPFMRQYVNVAKLRRTQGMWYPRKKQATWCVPLIGSDDNNLRFIVRIDPPAQEGQSPTRRFFMSRRDICVAAWAKPDTNEVPTPVIGDTSGFVYILDQDARSKNSLGYPITFETANTDFGFFDQSLATKMKAGQFLEIAYEPRGNWDLTVECFWDDVLTDTIVFNMGSAGAALGSFILDTDALAASSVRSKRVKMSGSGRRFRMAVTNAGAGQDVSISAFYVHCTVMDERVNEG